jgi:hypothetical protein
MRNRFEQQFSIGRRLIEETPANHKRTGKLEELIAAMKAIYCHPEYNQKIFNVLEKYLTKNRRVEKGWIYGAFLFWAKCGCV